MRRKGIIVIVLLLLGIGMVTGCNLNRQAEERPIHSKEEQRIRKLQVQNLQQENTRIQKVDMIHKTNQTKILLNNSPSVQLVHHNEQDKSHYYDNEAVVNFKESPSETEIGQIAQEIDGELKQRLGSVYIFKSNSKTTGELIEYFNQSERVEFAEPHYIYLQNEVNDTFYQNYQWNLPAIDTENGWNFSRGSEEIRIAVVDTGVDLNHPDLSGRLTEGYNVLKKNNNPQDDNGHGTHVAGIIAAVTNNSEGVAGITWFNPIMPVKVMNSKGYGGSLDVAEGILWAADHGADVINLSLGNYQSSLVMEEAINYALKKNIVVIAAAGNDNTSQPSFPAALPGVISVAAVDWEGRRAPFSNFGDYIDVAAPGVHIASTFINGQYASLSGTSMAAPHVTALAALVRSMNPRLKNTEVAEIMAETTQKVGEGDFDIYYGNGIIDNTSALELTNRRTHPIGKSREWFNRFFGR